MFKPSIKEMIDGKQSRYSLVIAVAKRARDITDEYNKAQKVCDEKPVLMAIKEFENGDYDIIEEESIHN